MSTTKHLAADSGSRPAFELSGKTAIVTGSTSGIGLGIARSLARAGMNIVLNGFGTPDEIKAARLELPLVRGREAIHDPADMSKADEIGALVERARSEFSTSRRSRRSRRSAGTRSSRSI
jgi:NAD(P)-dependent dehydrogenase (short-subunit alcohol dehydrogenase family)